MDHLEKYTENHEKLKAPKPPVKDYLAVIRAQRLDRESKQTSQEKINLVMNNKKLSNLEKLQRIKEETGRMERLAGENDRQSG